MYFKRLVFLLFSVFFVLHFSYAAETPPTGQSKESVVVPGGQSKGTPISEEGIGADVFGEKGGIFHPFLIVEEKWTDNLFITESNTKDSFVTTIAPGIWMAIPANRAKLLTIKTTTTSAGGLQLSRVKPEATRRYQAYALYSPEYVLYSDYSNHDHWNHNAEAMFQYNLNNGLSFDLIDVFSDREEISGDGRTDALYRHQDNLLDFITTYEPSEKLKLRFDYSNYILEYDEIINAYRDRMDNTFAFYAFYKFWPKTALFAQYAYADIDYDTFNLTDSIENRYYVGVNWEITAKTRGTFKLGYMDKDFDSPLVEDQEGFSFELQTQHNLTPKRALQVNAFRKFQESNTFGASSFYATGIEVGARQKFTEKWSATLVASYERDDYNGVDRDDDYFSVGPALRYEPRKWLIFDFGYFWNYNDSNINFYDYTSNELFLRGSISM
ncbi:MAG: outer membrane beta-barrel protein [Desulfobacteraceae bacterium]|nr:outer membrane beta-barrel protein [Desulfobacteraceae bacterium]